MIAILIGIGAIILGAKAFTPGGLPLTKKKMLKGTPAMIVGIFCILLGLLFIADGIFSIFWLVNRH